MPPYGTLKNGWDFPGSPVTSVIPLQEAWVKPPVRELYPTCCVARRGVAKIKK